MRSWLFLWLKLILAGYIVYLIGLTLLQERLIFVGWKMRSDGDSYPRPPYAESLWITGSGGERIEAWYLPGAGISATEPGPLVIFAHGNAELIDDLPNEAKRYRLLGVSVLYVEYRGFGRSSGVPSASGITSDFVAFHDLMVARPDVDPARIVLHGRSIGGAIVAQMALQRPPAAMILESTFTSIDALAWRYLYPAFLNRNPLDTARALPQIAAPILLIHGRQDDLVPIRHGRTLAQVARQATLVELDGGHNNFPPDPQPYWEAIVAFLQRTQITR